MAVTEDRTALLERFLRLRPLMIHGEYDPDKAESWTHELEHIFETMECAEEDQLEAHSAMVDCQRNTVRFRIPGEPVLYFRGGWDVRPDPLGPCGPILRVATCSMVATGRPSRQGSGRDNQGYRILVVTNGSIGCQAHARERDVVVRRDCFPVLRGDVFVPFGARRRRSFLREGPNGFVLCVEPCGGHDEQSYGVFNRVYLPYRASCSFASAVPFVGETSQQQRQGARRAEETGW
ncbi:hypothetical protein Taro_000171 [Colocasia esculenta]|uniref:Uncharacterized protein n=1 Tax=Colocasia esculenta TaxID=4460 RepID=A0A843TE24_COLES|nr:hypothetical protein [Colocasia esculenta]